ncbi:uncharacterized protein [Solanum lycopersicum]|uniref:uncharacterized protein n=1 Tax=Solanum lycopersicum TaxID=4081 RepID=UPI0002BCAE7A|nr:uncharacterized protein LOC101261371 [Solanum lycopersicum]
MHKLAMLAIIEPFSNQAHIESFRLQLIMDHIFSNLNNKIWLFWSNEISAVILESDQQQVTCEISHENCSEKFIVTYVYAKCKNQLRKPLWDIMLKRSETMYPWSILGDFNVITSTSEKLDGSDHCPLLMEIGDIQSNSIKYFKFLNCSTENESFLKTVENCWKRDVIGNPMWNFHTKLRRLTKTLREWSKQEYGDVFVKVKLYEELVKRAENDMICNQSIENSEKLNAINAKYIKYYKLEYKILQQKTQLHWLQEGDANTKYFHAVIRGKRNRMAIHKLMDDSGNWITGEENIAKQACDYYEGIFTAKNEKIKEDILQCIKPIITQERNDSLDRLPDMDELRGVIMSMNPHSAPGPDGFGGKFYQVCFDIIKEDLLAAVKYFYIGNSMPRYLTHASLILLPKTDHPCRLKDFRPISLSNFANKIISKIISTRFGLILPGIIFENQSGFVKGRSIAENILLAQEIINGIKKPKEGSNVVIKLDMVKAYDRVSWTYTCLVLRKLGFSEVFIDRVWRIMSNNWYSIVINGKGHGFFNPREVLNWYKGFHMERNGPKINHLSFADDIIIFASTDSNSLHLIMKTIELYEEVSDQQVNKHKSFFMVTSNTGHDIIEEIKRATGYSRKNSPINYLGCPLYIGGQRIIYYSEVVEKVIKRIAGWHSKILNFGGKITLVKHVLQSIPIHTLAAISPPKTTLNCIKKLIADFFWGIDKDGKKYHWSSWENMAYPTSEGGIGVRLLEDVCTAFQYMQWWDFRTKNSLWSQFLKAKYCQRANPLAKKYDSGDSLVWRYLTRNRLKVESLIKWQIHSGTSSFWWDNWLDNENLASQSDHISSLNNGVVTDFIKDGKWNESLIRHQVNPLFIPKILQTKLNYSTGKEDNAIWIPTETGNFTIASAWECIRNKRPIDTINTIIWHKHLPFKIAFFIWRALKGKLPTNELLQRFGSAISKCYCCYSKGKDDINHILINGNFAKHIWKIHAAILGVVPANTTLRDQLLHWRNQQVNNEVHKLLIHILPNVICWNLWKNRCAVKYGNKSSSIHRVQYGIFKDVMQVIKIVFPSIPWQSSWNKLINIVEHCKQQYKIVLVSWNKPGLGTYKLNTDGSALQNSGKIGGGGILRDHQGKIVYAFSLPFGFGTNNIAEIKAALYGLEWCDQHGYKRVELEVDSQLLCNWIKNKTNIPWIYEDLIQQIKQITRKIEQFQCHHIYREANITADLLSKWSHSLELVQHFYTKRQLEGRKLSIGEDGHTKF